MPGEVEIMNFLKKRCIDPLVPEGGIGKSIVRAMRSKYN